ncbi:MAG: glycosyltransferase family 2 protein [Candidatus Gracilibacteria bacterium]|nr:glycosyltransferase family 2 protein [Candidatus Gracilibacteria bacterium]
MYKDKIIGAVVPCYNEGKQISKVVETMPDFVDKIIIIDDKSKDNTVKVIEGLQKKYKKIILIEHKINEGVGGAITSGYKWCRDNKIDVAVVMAGDGQMLPKDLPAILDPVVEDRADYSKANRLMSGEAYEKIPKVRYFGNSVLSFLTKIASGYWHVMDSQTGFTAINSKMLKLIDWNKMYKRYGQPNDILVRLNVYNARVCDVATDPVYDVGEKSKIKIKVVIFTIPIMMLKMFLWRLKEKYIIRDFHPLVLFYFTGFISLICSFILMIRFVVIWILEGSIHSINFLAFMLCTLMAVQFVLFAMWFDMDINKDLKAV